VTKYCTSASYAWRSSKLNGILFTDGYIHTYTPVRQSLHKEFVFLLLLFFIKRKEAGLGTASRRKNNYRNYGLLHVFHAQAKIEACGYHTQNLNFVVGCETT
jgi:hypothetical protein